MSIPWLLIIIALVLNFRNRNALILTLIISLFVVVNIPWDYGALNWYLLWIFVEVIIFGSALFFKSEISQPVMLLSLFLIVLHLFGYIFDGSFSSSPYSYSTITLQYLEQISCILFSPIITNYIKRVYK